MSAAYFGQVLQGRDLAALGLEEHLTGSLIAAGDGFVAIPAGSLKTQQAAFGSRISTEYTRAVAAEAAIQADVDANEAAADASIAAASTDRALIRTELAAADAVVTTAFQTGDAAVATMLRGDADDDHNTLGKIEDLLDIETARVTAILAASNAEYDTFAETVALINSVDTANDTAFAAHVATYNAYVTSNDAALAAEVSANNSDHSAATTDRAAIRTEFAAADTALGVLIASHEAQLDDSFLSVSASGGCTLSFGSKAPQLKLVPDGAYIKLELSYKA
jgi:hypothetical protein